MMIFFEGEDWCVANNKISVGLIVNVSCGLELTRGLSSPLFMSFVTPSSILIGSKRVYSVLI